MTETTPWQDLTNRDDEVFEPVRDGEFRLVGSRCLACGVEFFPGRRLCFECQSTDLERALLRSTGSLYSFTTVYTAGDPYGLGYIDLPGGARVLARLEMEASEMRIGQQCVLVEGPGDGRVWFKPVEQVGHEPKGSANE